MYKGSYVYSQLVQLVPRYEFDKCVARYQGNYRARHFQCWQQFLCMLFGQLTYREGIRDIINCLSAHKSKLYHLGIQQSVDATTLSRANNNRDWRIWADFAHYLIEQARLFYVDDAVFDLDIDANIYALDSSTIDLCLNVFKWAKFRQNKGAVKLHTLLDLNGNIPVFIHISDGKMHDVHALDLLEFEVGAYYIMDKGYYDFTRLHKIHQASAFFVIRAKSNLNFVRQKSNSVDKSTGLRCDQIIRFGTSKARADYPDKLRRIKYVDLDKGKTYVFLTNNMNLDALHIALLYKYRWQIELFFKWIKQHLKIKVFWGHSPNAVKTQIWIAICTYLLVAIAKKKLNSELSLYQILQILSVSAFDKTPLNQLITNEDYKIDDDCNHNQLILF